MKVIFMGTPDFAVSTLEALYKAGHEISLVVTQPDRPKGRHGEAQKSDVRIAAESHSIPVITPLKIRNDEEARKLLKDLSPDVIVVTAFGQILPQDILDIPKYGCVNVHASLLPKYRGAAPIQWAVLNGDRETGVTTMQMDAGLDTGDILLTRKIALDPKETGGSLFDKLAVLGSELIVETLDKIADGSITRTPQDHDAATKVGMFTKSFGLIDWSGPAATIERKIRGLNPWPSAYTFLSGKQLKLWDGDVVSKEYFDAGAFEEAAVLTSDRTPENSDKSTEGRLFTDHKKNLIAVCGEDFLKINELQLEGKKRMTAADFLKGYRF
ncbi:methionyl-tRNA formyltransferase [Oribacterium sp. KHPX15]|uniref:methionyl-tRNA formyltransferase n=1 Tax=Oribacterium sp. KHPX15 TaxID=1855342 RepID=UPI00089C537D|nr:methionyl-tRNA formyltransferase [Oribacterium sp. KHPX15]SDZ87395.1 methionyl-tRNA formyltransferase [Oribacterium sp. KHPX15]